MAQDWQKESRWSAGRIRALDPARVTFRTDRRFFDPKLGLRPDGAYWVDDIVPAKAGYADVDARSYGCGDPDPKIETTSGAGPDPLPWVSQDIHRAPSQPAHRSANSIKLTLTNVASVRLERGACLSGRPVRYEIVSNGSATVTLSDGRSIRVRAGRHTGVLAAA